MTETTTVDRPKSFAEDVTCPFCGAAEDTLCVTADDRVRAPGQEHLQRWDALRAAYRLPRRYVLKDDDPRFGLAAGDVLVCEPYWLDPGLKLTVLYREADGFDPSCNVYRREVDKVQGSAGRVDRLGATA